MRAVYMLIYLGVVFTIGALVLPGNADELSAPAQVASLTDGQPLPALARIKAGDINCRGCDLSGTDLSHQCVKNGDLSGAKFDNATALYMCMSYANFSDASFRNTDLTAANLSHSNLSHADLTGAKLDLTLIKGTDLSTVRGLTQKQLDRACADIETRLPAGLTAKFCS
jgi:uncharacterized protein YjbI with pentapeptide repeats